jgi:hypothetical protein
MSECDFGGPRGRRQLSRRLVNPRSNIYHYRQSFEEIERLRLEESGNPFDPIILRWISGKPIGRYTLGRIVTTHSCWNKCDPAFSPIKSLVKTSL